jgi:flavin-dependent dehydrogenase
MAFDVVRAAAGPAGPVTEIRLKQYAADAMVGVAEEGVAGGGRIFSGAAIEPRAAPPGR